MNSQDSKQTSQNIIVDALRESESNMRRAQALAHLGNWSWDMINEKVSWSDEMYRIYGTCREEFDHTRAGILRLIHPDDHDKYNRAFESLRIGKPLETFEYRVVHKDGSIRHVQVTGSDVEVDSSGRALRTFGVTLDVTERKHTEEKLLDFQKQLRALSAKLSRVEAQERRHLATLLHDEVSQSLALASIKLSALRKLLVSEQQLFLLDSIKDVIDQSIQSTKTLTSQLSPTILYELGLEAALDRLSKSINSQYGIECTFEASGSVLTLDDDLKTLLYSAARELLINTIKHAKATSCIMRVSLDKGCVSIAIKDNGQGFDPSVPRSPSDTGGFGLFSIAERLRAVGGELLINSTPGRGTKIKVVVPVH